MKALLRRWYAWRLKRMTLALARTATQRLVLEQVVYMRPLHDLRSPDVYELRKLIRRENDCNLVRMHLLHKLEALSDSQRRS